MNAELTDLHSHLVPAVDDGARTIDDVLEGIGRMVECGVGRIVTTPHLAASSTLVDSRMRMAMDPVDESFARAKEAVADRFPRLEFHRAHEVMLDVPDPDLSDPRLWLGPEPVVLIEWPGLQFPPGTPRAITEMKAAGIQPLIAHPERYRVHRPGLPAAREWREAGAWLQVNHGSFVGRYGPEARAHAVTLLERGWADCLASDFHGRPHLEPYIGETLALFGRIGEEAERAWVLLTRVNPERIRRGEPPLEVPPVTVPRGMMGRIRDLLGGPR